MRISIRYRCSFTHLSTLLPEAVVPLEAVLALVETGARPALETGELEVTADIWAREGRFRGIMQNWRSYRGENLAHYTERGTLLSEMRVIVTMKVKLSVYKI